jgi:hypothetical protein
VATTGDGGAGAVRVSGAPSGGVSGAGAAADDVGSVIDFLSGTGFGARCVSIASWSRFLALTSKSTRRRLCQAELSAAIEQAGGLGTLTAYVLAIVRGDVRFVVAGGVRFDGCDGRRPPEC